MLSTGLLVELMGCGAGDVACSGCRLWGWGTPTDDDNVVSVDRLERR
jgi:hypothetical protein